MAQLMQVTADALEWVSAELEASLGRIGQLVESHLEEPEEVLPLQRALSEINQVRGTLVMIQCFGAAIVTDEIRLTLRAVIERRVERTEEAFDSLLGAVLQLSDYLDLLTRGVADSVLIFQPLINELRVSRGEAVANESELFVKQAVQSRPRPDLPDLGRRKPDVVLAAARRFHPAFQAALLQWLKNEEPELNLRRLGKIAEELHGLAATPAVFEPWWLFAAVIEGVLVGGVTSVAPVKRVSGHLARQLKSTAEANRETDVPAVDELCCTLLYHVCRSSSQGARETAVRHSYTVADLLPDEATLLSWRQRLRGPNSGLIGKLSEALKEDLGAVKDSIDLLVRAGDQSGGDMDELLELCGRISNTLAMLGLNRLRDGLASQIETLDDIRVRGGASNEDWMAIATTLVEVEQGLDSALNHQMQHGGGPSDADEEAGSVQDLDAGAAAIFRESLVNMARVKDAINGILTGGDAASLARCDKLLNEIEAGLLILGRPQGARLFARLRDLLRRAGPRLRPDDALSARIAEVVAALEWYLEALGDRRVSDDADNGVGGYLDALEKLVKQMPAEKPDEAIEATAPQQAASAAPVSEYDVDPEIRGIFVEEADEVLAELRRQVPVWSAKPDDAGSLTVMRRAFHTLKGSGRMVGATAVGDFGWSLENLLNRCLDGSLAVTPPLIDTVKEAVALLPGLIESFRLDRPEDPGIHGLIDRVQGLMRDRNAPVASPTEDNGSARRDQELVRVFHKDAYTRLRVIEQLAQDEDGDRPDLVTVTRALHTVRGSAESAGVNSIGRVAGALEDCLKTMASAGISVSDDARGVMHGWLAFVHEALDDLDSGGGANIDPTPVLKRIRLLQATLPTEALDVEAEQERVRAFTDEALDLLEQSERHLDAWYAAPDDRHHPEAVAGVMDTLTDRATHAGVEVFVTACRAVASRLWLHLREPDPCDPDLVRTLHEVLDGLYDLLDRLRFGERVTDAGPLLERLGAAARSEPAAVSAATTVAVEQPVSDPQGSVTEEHVVMKPPDAAEEPADEPRDETPAESPPRDPDRVEVDVSESPVTEELPVDAAVVEPDEPAAGQEPDVAPPVAGADAFDQRGDPELVAIFAEEAAELLEGIDAAVIDWEADPSRSEPRSELQRLLHTLKGSSRMARMHAIGDVSHELETYIAAVEQKEDAATAESVNVVRRAVDAMQYLVDRVTDGDALGDADHVVSALAEARLAVRSGELPRFDPGQPEPPAEEHEPVPAAVIAGPGPEQGTEWASELFWQPHEDASQQRVGAGETARVAVEHLDQMLNEGGEISIFRSRLERENTNFGFQLNEMSQTITRVGEQMRKLDLETESAILARYHGAGDAPAEVDRYAEEFDPLELDRYTRIHELSRAMSESLNDLSSLQALMEQSVRESDTLLVQQARVNTSLQQRLMGALTVPFSRQVSRLQRVVRQTAEEYGHEATLEVRGGDQELDRNVLQRMTAPLEHLLRNAVVHGIEAPNERERAGKAARGKIRLGLWREGSQLVIELRDDGRGLDLDAIRRKAESRGMLHPGQPASEEALADLIFERGFTTAARLTQTAGRGVGMDVVNAEIKQLGGTIQVATGSGQGARFEVRLPLSLAISQALLVRAGDETYAIPLRSIEGITLVDCAAVKRLLADVNGAFEYGGQRYSVGYIGDLVGVPRPDFEGLSKQVSMLLVRMGERRSAIAVDATVGSREVVMKSVGPQVSTVPGVNGATVLPDGQVVLILDVGVLLAERSRRRLVDVAAEPGENLPSRRDERPLVLVVDDSITVRRVSERLLTRSGYRVATARDGMDALAKLQSDAPDVVLLDIEMPRIDGFEVATYIRNTERLQHVPIVIVTSRSGEKHRQRARQIGVNGYLIKPYQEDELLAALRELIARAPTPEDA